MADSDIPTDQAKALDKYLQSIGVTAKDLVTSMKAVNDPTKIMVDMVMGVADNLERTVEYTKELQTDLTKMNKTLGIKFELNRAEFEAYKQIKNLAEGSEKIQRDLQDILQHEVSTRGDLVLQTTMLETGLEGVYAQMATTLKIEGKSVKLKEELVSLEEELSKYASQTVGFGNILRENALKAVEAKKKEIEDENTSYDNQVKLLQNTQAQNKAIEKQVDFTKQVAAETSKLKEQANEYKKKFEGFLATTKAIFSSPAAFATATAMALAKAGDKFSETFKTMRAEGMDASQATTATLHAYSTSISHLGSVSVEHIHSATKALLDQGSTLHDAEMGAERVADMLQLMGGSASDTGTALGFLQTMPGQTEASAQKMMMLGGQMAKAANVPLNTVTSAIAKNTAMAAAAGPKLMKSFAEAAVFAKKIGVEMSVFGSMAKGLLSFEESINRQMEASVLLGREINLDKARELANLSDIKGLQHEILKVVGSEAQFNEMSYLQKEALAATLNLEITDLQKIIAGRGKETALGERGLELEKEKAGVMTKLKNILAENAGSAISALAGITAALFNGITAMRLTNTLKATNTALTGANTPVVTANAMSIRAAGVAAKGAAMSMLAFGAAILMIGLGIGAAALGFAQLVKAFDETKNAGMALAAIAAIMIGFAIIVYIVSKASLAAAPGLYALGGAMLMIGGGIFLATAGMALLIYSLSKLNTEQLAQIPIILAAIVVPMTLLGISFMIMASGLAAMGAAATLAMPLIGSLIALAAVATVLTSMSGFGLPSLGDNNKKPAASKESNNDQSLKPVMDAITALTKAVSSIKGDVTLEGDKVGKAVWTYVQTHASINTSSTQR